MSELTAAFTQQTGIECEIILASSGKLTAQIQAGAPYDVFVAADLKYPERLQQQELIVDSPTVYAYGKLVLWTTQLSQSPSLAVLTDKSVQRIALANPKTAPYGRAALALLKRNNLYERVETKLVFGESIAQTNQFITTGAAQVGFTAQSVVAAAHLKNTGYWTPLPAAAYQPLAQGVCILRSSSKIDAARQFKTFLLGSTAAKILHTFGYDSPLQSVQ